MQFPLGPGVCAGLAEQKLRREAGWQEEEAAEGLFLHLPDHGVPAQLHAQREPQPLSRLPSSAFLPDSRRSLPVRTGATDPFKTETAQGAPQESRPWQEAVMLGGSLWGCAPPALSGERRGAGGLELLLLLVLSGWVWAQQPQLQAAPCPTPCECSEAHRIVKCVNKNLTEVPPELPPFVQGLFLPSNCIRNLSSASFLSASLSGLSSLSLRGNRLSWVGAETFAGLPRLKQLDLSDNSLTWLSPVALGNASSPLEELDLSSSLYNSSGVLLVAELLQTGTLLSLKHLDLSGNSLVYLPASMFSALPSLEHLDMHNNSLVSLRTVFFGSLQQLQSFNLGSNAFKALRNGTLQQLQGLPFLALNLSCNPWVCDCHIEDLVNWLKESKQVEAKGALKCSYPRELQERSLVSINVSELSCPLPIDDQTPLQTSYVFLGIVLALIGAIFLLVLYLNRKGIKKWVYNIRDACRDHMEGYHYRYEINTDPRLTNLNSNSDV